MASAYGIQACIVTAAGPDADLSVFKEHELHLVRAERTLTFEHSYTWWGEFLNHALLGPCFAKSDQPQDRQLPTVWYEHAKTSHTPGT